jgi:hypothetical protein
MQCKANIATSAKKIAAAAAGTGAWITFAHVTPTSAATKFPPRMDQGCASGLAGTPNNSTADAPIGAISQAAATGEWRTAALRRPVNRMPSIAPRPDRKRSAWLTVARAGSRAASHRGFDEFMKVGDKALYYIMS